MNRETLPPTEIPAGGGTPESGAAVFAAPEVAASLNESRDMLRLVEPVVPQTVYRALKARLERQAKGFTELLRWQAESRARAERYSGVLDGRYFEQQFFKTP